MYSSKLDLCLLSKPSYSNCTHRVHSCHSSHETYVDRCDVKSNDSCWRLVGVNSHTMEIHEENVVDIDLPPLVWFEYNKTPKLLTATNTGRTILINGQWTCSRPYITGGPLNGCYIFSQIHFHSPSEHEIDGRRYPLEMHVVHYKNSYLTQERAMKEKDGTIVLVYLFQLIERGTTVVSQVSKLASSLEKKNARKELDKFPLDLFVKPFNTNYYTYQSSVPADKNSYLLQWIISCNNLSVTREEVEELQFVMNSSNSTSYPTALQPENDVVFRVGEEDYCGWISGPQVTEDPCEHEKVCKKGSKWSICKRRSKGSICKRGSKGSICKRRSKGSICKKRSKCSICCKRSSKGSICCKKTSKDSICCKRSSKGSICCKKTSKNSICCKRGSKGSICRRGSKGSICRRGSKGSICKRRSKKPIREKCSKTYVCKKSCKKSVNKKSSKTTPNEQTSQKSDDEKSSKTSLDDNCSKTSVHEKSSKTSISDKSSETSCASAKTSKNKRRDKSKSVKVCEGTNTTPSCSRTSVKEKKKKKSKDVSITKERSKSKVMQEPKDQCGTSEISVPNATTCTSKESKEVKKSKKSSKTKVKSSDGDKKEKCVEIQTSGSAEKLDCSEANLNTRDNSTEKVKILYKKKRKAPVAPSACDTELSNAVENIDIANICDSIDPCEDVKINYILVPSNLGHVLELKNKESSTKTERTRTESKDFLKLPSHSVINHAIVNAIKFPVVKSGETKHLCIHTKHIFRTEEDNREFTPHSFQECHILVERDHNVLQEYNGSLHPRQLVLGNYEQINLSARYAEPGDLNIHATECIAKLESLNELSIRAKFVISETNLNGLKSETFLTRKKSTDSVEGTKSYLDAQCQCSMQQPVSTSVAIDTEFLEKEVNLPCKSLIKWDLRNMGLESLDFKNTELVNMQDLNKRVGNEVKFKTRNEEQNSKKALVEQNGGFKLLKNSNTSGPEWGTALEDLSEQINEREVDSEIDDKRIKNSLNRHKRTAYFVYDRIEKDENSEIRVLYKPEYLFQSDRTNSDTSDTQSNFNRDVISGNESRENVSERTIRVEDSQVNKERAWKEEDPAQRNEFKQLDHKKEVITLHKFEPKNLRAVRKKSKNRIVGKISSKVDTESEKYSQLVTILGEEKTRVPNISFYEFQESDSYTLSDNVSLENNSKFDIVTLKAVVNSEEVDKDKVLSSTSERSDCLDGGLSEGLEGPSSSVKNAEPSDSKDSQAAVIVLPIEVNSLSKVEIVLIEHADDVKKQKVENKYTSYLKHYKRLILTLKSSFL